MSRLVLGLAALLIGCGTDTLQAGAPPIDADSAMEDVTIADTSAPDTPDASAAGDGAADTSIVDTSTVDAGPLDASAPDTAAPDTSLPDAATADTQTPDANAVDTSVPDTQTPDTGTPDTGTPDTSDPDAATADTQIADASAVDTSAIDTSAPDASVLDIATADTSAPDTSAPDTSTIDTGPTCPGGVGCPCVPEKEVCNGKDDDCNGQTDEVICDDSNPCTTGACDGKAGKCAFSPRPNGTACDADGSVCTVADGCVSGGCKAGTAKVCDDKKPCTTDSCHPSDGCTHVSADGAACDDGDPCTLGDMCALSACKSGQGKTCPNKGPCTVGLCDAKKGGVCVVTDKPAGTPCDADGTGCTAKDACNKGSCVAGKAKDCGDGNACTTDVCAGDGLCLHWSNTEPCSDGNGCTVADACKGEACTSGKSKSCDDKSFCTVDSCDTKTGGCVFEGKTRHGLPCDADGSVCTVGDACDQGTCKAGAAKKCSDGNPCTSDVCDSFAGCTTKPTADEQPCGAGATTWCKGGGCVEKWPAVGALRDYGFWYWPTNHRPTETWPKVERAMHVLTGHYGLAMNEATGALERLGWLDDALDVEAALKRSNAVIAGFPTAKLSFEGGAGTGSAVATSFLGTKGATVDRAQMLDGGRIMNRLQFETVGFASNSKLKGRVTLAAMPRHFTLTQTLTGHAAAKVARIRIGGAALAALPKSEWLVPGRVLRRTNGAGKGWVFLVADVPGQSLATNVSGEVVAQRSVSQLAKAGTTVALTVLAAQAVSAAELSMFMTPNKAVQVSYQLLNLAGKPVGAPVVAPWNAELGAYKVPLGTLKSAGAPGKPNWEQAVYHNWYGRHRLTVTRVSKAPMAVPLALFGSGGLSWYITGGAPLWRDSKGRPTGTPIQVSKNWHGQVWYHLYSQPTFRGPGADTLELTMASSRWGPVFAASHAQLSLVGWSQAGGHWDESALGCFGESITYDPDVTLNRAMVDDVRPFQVLSKTKWSWTGNVGGADFLRYATTAKPYWERRLGRVRSHYAAPGPNLTDVVYAGVSSDGAIRATIRTQLVGTDDVVRAYYHLDYEFLKDVDYSRLAFFQVAADNYADNLFAKYAYGNASGAIKVAQSTNHKSKGYASNAHRGIALPGKSPWVLLYNNQRTGDSLPERFANVGFVVRSFEAKIGQATLTTPHINLTRTYNGKMSQMAFQLGLPHTPGSTWCGAPCLGKQRFVPKGSRVRATVEYLVLPANKSRYYGESAWLKALAPSLFDHPEQIRQVAANNQLVVQATVGKVLRAQPVVVDAEATQAKMGMIGPGAVVADLTMSGGLGFVPVTIAGLPRHGGWRLQRLLNGTWVTYDPAVHGNDHWQAEFTALSQDWRLTFSLPGVTKQRVRLVSE